MLHKIFYSGALFFLAVSKCSQAQTLISQMGPVRFFNSLDSAKSATLTRIAGKCFCMLQHLDSSHSRQLKLDLAQNTQSGDSVFYFLDFNNLQGDYSDSLAEAPGIYIKARDSVLRSEIILRLVDYGVQHYAEMQNQKKSGNVYSEEFILSFLKQKPSLAFKKAMAKCK